MTSSAIRSFQSREKASITLWPMPNGQEKRGYGCKSTLDLPLSNAMELMIDRYFCEALGVIVAIGLLIAGAILLEYCQMSLLGNFQAAGFSLIPSMNLVPRTTSASSGDPFNDRQPFDADSISLNTIVRHAARVPLPLVLS